MTDAAPTTFALATELGSRLFGHPPLVSRFQASHSDVFRLDFDRGTPAHLIKIAQDDPGPVLREQQVVRDLQRLEFEVPALEFTQADCPDVTRPFTILPMISGMSAAAIYSQDARRGADVFERLGRFLGRLAAVTPESIPAGMSPDEARARELAVLDARYAVFSASKWFKKDLAIHFDKARHLMETPPSWFGHRDGGRLVTDGKHLFTVIEWGEAGAVWPYTDLARQIHAMRALHDLWGGKWLECLLRGFGATRPLEDGWIEIVEAWLVYYCLRDAAALIKSGGYSSISKLVTLARSTVDRQWLQGT